MSIHYKSKTTGKKIFVVARKNDQVLIQYVVSTRRSWVKEEDFNKMFKSLDEQEKPIYTNVNNGNTVTVIKEIDDTIEVEYVRSKTRCFYKVTDFNRIFTKK